MPTWILIVLGSAVGGLARWAMVMAVDARTGGGFPWGTLAVNVLGGLAIGACAAVWAKDSPHYALLAIGVLGGFTTFSSYSLQTLDLLQQGRIAVALAYALGSMLACLLACWAGWAMARPFAPA